MATDAVTSRSKRAPLSIRQAVLERSTAVTAALVMSVAMAILLLTGVSVADVARYAAFEVLFVLVPGCLLYMLLSRRPGGRLRTLAIGWPLGYAIEIAAFAFTAAIGRRGLFLLLPPVAILVLASSLLRTRRSSGIGELGNRLRRIFARDTAAISGRSLPLLVVGGIVACALIMVAIESFTRFPLPQYAVSVVYYEDNIFDISIAAEARHHWPIMVPYVAGQSFRYYTGYFMHVAAVNQVTGVSLATVVLRLFPVTVVVVIVMQLLLLGRELGRSYWAGAIAVALFFPINDLGLNLIKPEAFGYVPFNQLGASPTLSLGVTFFLALLAVIGRRLDADASHSQSGGLGLAGAAPRGSLLLTGALMLGASAVKTVAAVDILGGMGLFWLWRVMSAKDGRMFPYIALSTACVAVVYYLMLAGGVSTISVHPFDFMHSTLFVALYPARSILGLGLLICAAILTCCFFFVPVLGALWTLYTRSQNAPSVAFIVSVFVVATCAYVMLKAEGDAEMIFITYGLVAMMPVAAVGLLRLWRETPQALRSRIIRACFFIFCLGVALALSSTILVSIAKHLGRNVEKANGVWMIWYVVAFGIAGCATVLLSLTLERHYAPAIRSRVVRVVACAIPMVVTLGLIKTLCFAFPAVLDIVSGTRVDASSADERGMTSALYRGLTWVRSHTDPCAILAVNNHSSTAREVDSKFFYYSAFAEREVFLESWAYTPLGSEGRQPYPRRLALNDRATVQGDPNALRELARLGVSYVLVDKLDGGGAEEPTSVSKLVFADSALDVYRLIPPAASARGGECRTLTGV